MSILHVAGPSFGRGVPVTPTQIIGQVRTIEDAGAPPPALLIIPGGLTADAARPDFRRAAEFIHTLRTELDLRPDRIVIVPGPGDVSMNQSNAYFLECADDGVAPMLPYHRKWKHFEALFNEFYEGMNGTGFGAGAPWTKFAIPDLRIAVAGFNTTYAMSHLPADRHGLIGEEQTNAFSPWLRDQERLDWLRIGVMAHAPVVDQLDDAEDFQTDLTRHLSLLFHGGHMDVESPPGAGTVYARRWHSRTAVFSPDDQLLAVGGSDAMVRVFKVSTGQLVWKRPADRNVYRVAISANGGLLAASDEAGAIQMWRVSDGTAVSTLAGHARAVYTIALHPNGWLLASGDTSGLINLWDVRTGRLLESHPHHRGVVYQVRFSHKGALMVSCDSDGGCQVWSLDAADGTPAIRPVVSLVGHMSSVWPPIFRNDDLEIATASNDESVRLWDVGTGQCNADIRGHGRQVSTLSFNRTSDMVVAASKDGLVRIWNPITGEQLRRLSGRANQLVSAVFNPVANTVVTGTNDGGAHRFNADTGMLERELKLKTVNVWAEAFSPDGEVVATANDDDSVSLWHHRTGAQGHNLQLHKGRVRSISFAPEGDLLATGCDDGKVRLWSVAGGVCTQTLEGHTNRVYGVQFNHDGTLLASGGWDGTVRIWSRDGWRLLRTLADNGGPLWATAYHPTLDIVACAGDDGRIHVWDAVAGRKLIVLDAHMGKIFAITFSPDGGLLATGGNDGAVRIWDTTDPSSPTLKVTLIGQGKGWAAVSPQGRYKIHDLQNAFWYAVGGCRLDVGELDPLVPGITRMFVSQEF